MSAVGKKRLFAMTRMNRVLLADVLDSLDDVQWEAPTLCEGWTVHVLAAHLVQSRLTGFGAFFLAAWRHRGDTDRTVDFLARREAHRPREELTALLRRHAEDRTDPPRVGPFGPFADTCLHLRDIARPLGLDVDVPASHWQVLLDYLTGPRVAPALVPKGRLSGLRIVDEWGTTYGDDDPALLPVRGAAEALAMAAAGRSAALKDLTGAGVEVLRERVFPAR